MLHYQWHRYEDRQNRFNFSHFSEKKYVASAHCKCLDEMLTLWAPQQMFSRTNKNQNRNFSVEIKASYFELCIAEQYFLNLIYLSHIVLTFFGQRNTITLCLLVPSADTFCKELGTRSGPTKCWAWSGSKLFDTLMIFLKEFFKNINFEKKSADDKKARKFTQ